VGEHSNFILVPMLLKSLTQLNRWKPENVQSYCNSITADAVSTLRENGFWIEEQSQRAAHLFGVRLKDPTMLPAIKEMLLKKKIYVSYRGDAMRISANVYNDESDLQRLAKVLIKAVK
jgi:hypothetical protein